MDRQLEINIIIPVYNAAETLQKCVDSVLTQTFGNWKLILVDDGSTDKSVSICRQYAEKDSRIVVLEQKHKGVSAARNRGLEVAKGDYICFVDSDDYVAHDYFNILLGSFKKYPNVDWCLSGICDVQDGNIVKRIQLVDRLWNLEKCDDCEVFFQMQLLTALFPKLYKRDIIMDHNIRFNEIISFAEDREFNMQYAFYVNRAVSISYIGYFYRKDNQSSLSRKYYPYTLKYDCLHWELLKENFERRGHSSKNIDCQLYTELFHRINDNICKLSKQMLWKDIKVTFNDLVFYLQILRRHVLSINAPIMQKIRLLYFFLI